jgi:hypothetical protein
MKKIFFAFLITTSFFYQVFSQERGNNSLYTKSIEFQKDSIHIKFLEGIKKNPDTNEFIVDYGEIKKGENGKRIISFKNKGKMPIIIRNIQTSCGCTTPSWPRKPIYPKKSDQIIVEYDTLRVGKFNKTILATFLSGRKKKEEHYIKFQIKGEVLDKIKSKL